jgi:hypothetical protein
MSIQQGINTTQQDNNETGNQAIMNEQICQII